MKEKYKGSLGPLPCAFVSAFVRECGLSNGNLGSDDVERLELVAARILGNAPDSYVVYTVHGEGVAEEDARCLRSLAKKIRRAA